MRTAGPLFPLLALFLVCSYTLSGRFGLGTRLDEQQALALHKLLHLPRLILLLVHSGPAVYLALQRWGWIAKPRLPGSE